MRPSYDYIIVGAGSSGCVLANKLSENPDHTVLLVESGPDNTHPLIAMPRGMAKLLQPGNPHVWDYEVSPGGNAPPEIWLKGRAIGGSSSINGSVYVRGAPYDYDGWAALGCTGWGWDEMLKHFIALEDHQLPGDPGRGRNGPLKVSVHATHHAVCEAVLAAAAGLGVQRVDDINALPAIMDGGIGYQTANISRGKRVSAAGAFLTPARRRRNLDILPDTDVLRIRFRANRAIGVNLRNHTGAHVIDATREVIISAGAVQSPKLLQLSGIGPAALLASFNIPLVADSPDVGRNLREHRHISTKYKLKGGSFNSSFAGAGLVRSLLQYALFSSGPLTHAAHELGGFIKSRPGLEHPDIQLGVSLYSMRLGKTGMEPDRHPGLTVFAYFTRPQSQGELRIQSADPMAKPIINANHFAAEIDRISAVSLFRWLRRLAAQPALREWIVEETYPGPSIATDEDVLQNAVSLGGTAFHIAGTCRMGADDAAVLDPQLRVRGVTGLRVVDTSIMPTLVSGNTSAPAMAIALRAAEMIRAAA